MYVHGGDWLVCMREGGGAMRWGDGCVCKCVQIRYIYTLCGIICVYLILEAIDGVRVRGGICITYIHTHTHIQYIQQTA